MSKYFTAGNRKYLRIIRIVHFIFSDLYIYEILIFLNEQFEKIKSKKINDLPDSHGFRQVRERIFKCELRQLRLLFTSSTK